MLLRLLILSERGEQQRTVTAFIREATATSRAREFLERYSEQPDSRESHLPPKHIKCGSNNTNNDYNTKDFQRINLISDGLSKIAIEQKFIHAETNNDIMNNNGNYIPGDVSRATQTIDKPSSNAPNFNELNSISSLENGCVNTNKIAYIDEDEHTNDPYRSSNMHIGDDQGDHVNAVGFNNIYTQGNSVQEIRALNDSEDDEAILNIMSKVSKDRGNNSTTEAKIASDKIQKSAEANPATGTQGKHDDNPFTYSAGQLRLHGNRVGTYDMQKSRTLGVKRDVLTADVSLIPANTSNSLLARDLVPAQFDGRETYARGLLDPTEDTRLNPQQANLDNEMANLKNQPDKCAIAKRRKENKKAKEAKNSYVVESKDGYMGNLSPEEILKRIEGDSKGKAKGNQKNGTNGSKDHSSIVTNGSRSSGGRKRSDKKDKAARRSLITDREVIELSAKMETLNTEKAKTVVVAETIGESKHESLMTGMRTSKAQTITSSSPQSNEIDEARSGATAAKVTMDEGVDDEEQYLSADEGANSNFSDDIYHTDEQSGASGSRDFISDGANYRADDEEVNPLPLTSEESEFIQVTGRSKRRAGAALVQHQQQTVAPGMDRRNVYFNSAIDRGARANIRRGGDRLRRSSIQLPPDSRRNQLSSCGNTSPSSVDYESSGGKGQTTGTSSSAQPQQQRQQQHLKFATSTSMSKKGKYGLPSSLQTSRTASPDRRSNQPLTLKYSVTTESSGPSPAVAPLSERKVLDHQIGTVTVVSAKAPAQRSWAEIAKQRLYDNVEIRPNEATMHNYPRTPVKEEHSVSAASSISGHAESAKKVEHSEQNRTISVETINSDLAVKDYSFFFDPNEPAGILSKESEPNSSKTVPKKANEDSKTFKPRCSGMVLNLDGGRQIVLPESDMITTGPASIVDIRQRPEVIIVNEMWKDFTKNPAEIMTYREYQRQKQGSDQKDRSSKEKNKETTKGVKKFYLEEKV
ncbi:ATP synthase subunit d [Dirofilaria immitis]